MKHLMSLIALSLVIGLPRLAAQSDIVADTIVINAPAREQQVFKSLAIVNRKQCDYLEFEVKRVSNVRNYRVEAGDDVAGLALIGTLAPGRNTMMPSRFAFPLNGGLNQYKYYRVVQVSMAQEWTPSPVLSHFFDGINSTGYAEMKTLNEDAIATWFSFLKR